MACILSGKTSGVKTYITDLHRSIGLFASEKWNHVSGKPCPSPKFKSKDSERKYRFPLPELREVDRVGEEYRPNFVSEQNARRKQGGKQI